MRPSVNRTNPVIEFNGQPVYSIDGVNTILNHIHGDLASGYILNSDLTTKPCYVARGQGFFAHGETAEKAISDLEAKILNSMPIEDRVNQFVEQFKLDQEYLVEEFYKWHNILTGSCEIGRNAFMRDHELSLTDSITTKKFIELTQDAFGAQAIQMLKKRYGLA